MTTRKKKGCRFVLVTRGGGGASLARCMHAELGDVTTCVVDVPADRLEAVDWIVAEAGQAVGYVEAYYDAEGTRREPRLRTLSLEDEPASIPLTQDDVLLITGGGKGIAAECGLSLARKTGVKLALLGRSDPQHDELLAANLQRMGDAGVRFHYGSADVTDEQAVRKAVDGVQSRFGPITAVLHAAGWNAPQRLGGIDRDSFLRTVRPKIDGARHVLAAVDPQRLRLLITFGSIIARAGLQGEAEYAVANEWLTQLTERWQQQHPDCRCLAAEFSVWSGAGMGERLGTLDALKQQGIAPIPMDEGTHLLQRVLGHDSPCTVVLSSRFGRPPTLRFDTAELPLLRFLESPRVHVPGVELVVDAELSFESDPYVADHIYQQTPLFPAVMGLEAMAQAAMALRGGAELPEFDAVRFAQPIVVADGNPVTIRVAALLRSPNCVEVALRTDQTGFQVDHFRGTCRWQSSPVGLPELLPEAAASRPPVPLRPDEELYGTTFFHTGRFRRLAGYQHLTSTECVARIRPEGSSTWFGRYLPDSLVLGDPAARDAALHGIQACIPHGTLLPTGVDRLVIGRPLAGPLMACARERFREGDDFVYDLEVSAEDGQVWERWEGLRLRRVAPTDLPSAWPAPLLGPYLERRLGELVPDSQVSIAVQWAPADSRRAKSDSAIRQAAGFSGPLWRRADGKPESASGECVSASHAGPLTLAVASGKPVGCDVESISARPEAVWRDLLDSQRYRLAELIAARSRDDRDAAATRVWAAAECLTKVGRGFDTPLIFESCSDDDWVVLTAGTFHVATWVTPVRDFEGRIAFALCVENGGARI